MKILIVINDYMNSSNGMCISTQRFVGEYKKMGHQVRIVTNNRYGELDYPLDVVKVPVFSDIIEKEGYTFAKVNRQVIRKAVEWADVVHLEDPFLVCRRAGIEAKRMNKPVTGTFHLYPENMTYAVHMGHAHLMNFWFMRLFLKSVYNRCDYINCPTEEVAKRLENYKIKSKLKVISNGIDDKFLFQKRSREFDGTLRVLSVGRYAVEKNQKLLIEAVAKCNHRDNIQVTLAGKGPLSEKLKECATKLGVQVEFGFLSQEQLREKMLESDLYVHCANVEVEGMSCMEAFACGCVPVISNARLSSTKDFALHKENLFQNRSAKSLAEKIDFFYEHPEKIAEQSKEYMEYGQSQGVEICGAKMIEMMEQAISERSTLCQG